MISSSALNAGHRHGSVPSLQAVGGGGLMRANIPSPSCNNSAVTLGSGVGDVTGSSNHHYKFHNRFGTIAEESEFCTNEFLEENAKREVDIGSTTTRR